MDDVPADDPPADDPPVSGPLTPGLPVDDGDWLATMAIGVALLVIGAWLATSVFESVVVLAALGGVTLIVGGVVEGAGLDADGRGGRLGWAAGGMLVLAGVAVLVWPDITLRALAVVAGSGVAVAGVLRALHALTRVDPRGRVSQVVLGAAELGVGLAVVCWPGTPFSVLAVLLGLRSIVSGLVAVLTSWQIHRLALPHRVMTATRDPGTV